MTDRYNNLIRRITGIGFDIGSDWPGNTQIESARDGVMTFSEYPVDDYGYITGPPSCWDGTFEDAMSEAEWVTELDIRGLTDEEVFELVTSPRYQDKLMDLAAKSELGDRIFRINGIGFLSYDGELFATVRPKNE